MLSTLSGTTASTTRETSLPSKSAKQARLMAAAAHNPQFAKKVGIPVKVAKEFNSADAGTGILKRKGKKSWLG